MTTMRHRKRTQFVRARPPRYSSARVSMELMNEHMKAMRTIVNKAFVEATWRRFLKEANNINRTYGKAVIEGKLTIDWIDRDAISKALGDELTARCAGEDLSAAYWLAAYPKEAP